MGLAEIIRNYSSKVVNLLPRPSTYLYSVIIAGVLVAGGCKSILEERLKEIETRTGHTFSEKGRGSFFRQDYKDCSPEMFEALTPFIERYFESFSYMDDAADGAVPIFLDFYIKTGTVEYAKEMTGIRQGDKPFVDLISLTNFNHMGIEPDTIGKFAELKNSKGEFVFSALDLYYFLDSGGSLSDAQEAIITCPEIDGFTLYRCWQLKINPQEAFKFTDTEKPNAVFIFGNLDWGALEHSGISKFFRLVHQHYDVWPVLNANTEDDVYSAINKIPNADLLVIAAHGASSSERVCIGYDEETKAEREEHSIDFEDKELPTHLEKLNPDATILLVSCLAGKNGKGGNNIANYFIRSAHGRIVVSPMESITGDDVVADYDPELKKLEITFMKDGKDVTYTNK